MKLPMTVIACLGLFGAGSLTPLVSATAAVPNAGTGASPSSSVAQMSSPTQERHAAYSHRAALWQEALERVGHFADNLRNRCHLVSGTLDFAVPLTIFEAVGVAPCLATRDPPDRFPLDLGEEVAQC